MQRLGVICALLLLSGAAGLSYELLWVRMLGRLFGHTVHAVTSVLATFMAGLALGSALFGRRADRSKNALRLYALLELGIGLSCLVAPFVLEQARAVYIANYPALGESLLLRSLLQLALSAAVLLLPATLMGGTLPAALKAVTRESGRAAADVALLYGSNTAGAALGALAAGYLLLPSLGIWATNLVAVAINLAIGGLLLWRVRGAASAAPAPALVPQARPERSAADRWLLAGLLISGALAMSYQIVWTRALILVIGSSTYAFTAILVTFLVGLALGSYLFRLLRARASLDLFAFLQLAIGLSALGLIPFFDSLPALFTRLFAGYTGGFGYVLLIQFAVVAPFVLLPTLCLGMTLPCAIGVLSREATTVGRDSGRLYAYNTLGAIAGSVLTGFVLLPQLGAQWTLSLGIALNFALAAALQRFARPQPRPRLAIAIAVAGLLPMLLPAWDPVGMSVGVSIYPRGYGGAADGKPFDVLLLREGVGTTVAVTTTPSGGKSLRVNGKVDASTEAVDMLTQARLAYLPLLLHPNPHRVAIVGLGSGVTAGAAALFPSVEKVDVVELEPAVVEAAKHFAAHNFGALRHPKVAIHLDDARSFLELRRGAYDVLISEPSNPWIAGVASLFSAEFMTLAHERLAPQGVFCQWLQLYSISPVEMKLIMRTFLHAFADASVWRVSPTDYILIGRKQGSGRVSAERVARKLDELPQLGALIAGQGELPGPSVWTSFVVDSRGLAAYAGSGPLNTEDLPHLEFSAPRSLYVDHGEEIDRDLWAHKTSAFPSFVDVAPADVAAAPMHFGQYLLLLARQPRPAAWFLQRVPALSGPGPSPARPAAQAQVLEDFEGASHAPLLPRVAGVLARPDEDGEALGAAFELLLGRSSGVVPGAGLGGSRGLVLHALPQVGIVGFALPFAVEPSRRYRLTYSLQLGDLAGGEVGIEVEQLAAQGQVLQGDRVARIRFAQRWTRGEISLATTERTRIVRVTFSRSGQATAAPVSFDEILLEAE